MSVGKETGELASGPEAAAEKLLEEGFYWQGTEMSAGNVNGKVEGEESALSSVRAL